MIYVIVASAITGIFFGSFLFDEIIMENLHRVFSWIPNFVNPILMLEPVQIAGLQLLVLVAALAACIVVFVKKEFKIPAKIFAALFVPSVLIAAFSHGLIGWIMIFAVCIGLFICSIIDYKRAQKEFL